jgi:CO/xanthine dehydrogenase FAD-binding subunit
MKAAIEKYSVPGSLEEATRLLAEGKATLFAGGTDLMLQTRAGAKNFQPVLVNINRIPDLKGIARSNDTIRVGALTTITEILKSRELREHAKIVCDTADCFAGGQIRNAATLGGNICNASPAGDMIIPLLLLDAEVELASWSEGGAALRRMPLSDFFTGPGTTRIEANEVLTCVEFKVPEKTFAAAFEKFGTRPAMDISVVSVGIAGVKDGGVLRDVRVALGAVAPTPLRGKKTEAAIEGRHLDEERTADAGRIAQEEISPIADIRGSAWYRRELTATLTRRLLRHVTRA